MVGTSAGAFVAEMAWVLSRSWKVELLAPRERIRAAATRFEALSADMGGAQRGAPDLVPVTHGALFRRGEGRSGLFSRGAVDALEARPRLWFEGVQASWAMFRAVHRRGRGWRAALAHWLAPSGLVCGTVRDLPLVVVVHSGDVHLLSRLGLLAPVLQVLARPGVRLMVTSAFLRDRLLGALSGRLAEWVATHGIVQPMGFFAQGMGPCPTKSRSARAVRFGLDADSRPVLFVGRLEPVKGPDIFVDVAKALTGRHLDVPFLVVGDGPMRKDLEYEAQGRVRFLGRLERPDLIDLLSLAHVVVVPSRVLDNGRTESAPVILAEARAGGAAVLAADVGGIGELVTHGRDGLLVSPEKPEAFIGALDAILRDDALARRLSLAGRRRALEMDWAAVIPRVEGLLEEAIRELA